MPTTDEQFKKVVGEYSARGLPGCVGIVDCVHVGWDKRPSQYHYMFTGKEGFPSIAYKVICSAVNLFRPFLWDIQVPNMTSTLAGPIIWLWNSLVQENGWVQSKS